MTSDKKCDGEIVLVGHVIFKSEKAVKKALSQKDNTVILRGGFEIQYESFVAYLEAKRLRKIEKSQARKARLQQRIA